MYVTTGDSETGTVQFDDRGNARWVAKVPVNTDDTLMRILDISALALMPDELAEVRRDGFNEVFRSGG